MRTFFSLKAAGVGLTIGLICFAAGVLTAGGGRRIKTEAAAVSIAALKRISILLKGEERYVQESLATNYRRQEAQAPEGPRLLDSSRLPLTVEVVSLAGQGEFATNEELTRGALTIANGHLIAMDKMGNIFRVDNGSLRKMDYGKFPSGIDRYIVEAPRTLPQTAVRALYIGYDQTRHWLLVSHQRFVPQTRHVRFTISAIQIDAVTDERDGQWRTLFETEDIPDAAAFRGATGGRLVVERDTLYFTVGDYNFGQVPQDEWAMTAQDPKSSFGKVWELDLGSGRSRVKSIGHRNPQGLVYTRGGLLIDAEHGPEGGDELNVIRDGLNFGWPYKTYGTDYGTFNWPLSSRAGKYAEPLYAWVPSAAISPLAEVADFNEAWDGDLLVGSLKAQTLFRLKMVDGRVIFAEPIWLGHRIRDIVVFDKQVVLMTDDPALLFIKVDQARLKANSKLQKHVEFNPALAPCLKCHHFGPTNPSHLAPSLAGVLGRKIASDSFERYSSALRQRQGTWEEASLARFLANPAAFAPGTSMPNPGLNAQQVAEVVAALGRQPAPQSAENPPR